LDNRVIHVPVSWLLDSGQTASTKVVCMALRLHPAAGPAELAVHTGLSHPTVLSGLNQAGARNRAPVAPQAKVPLAGRATGPQAKVPSALLAERSTGAQAKVLYGLLQATPDFRGQSGQFTYASLRSLTQLGRNTLKRAITDLLEAGWIQVTQANQLSPVHFTLGSPELKRSQAEAAVANRRLKRTKYGGEAIMQEYLSLLIDSDQFTDNARPGFLVNPLTGERLELDRFYLENVAFEFNGSQHYDASARFSQAEVDAQHLRDLIKAGICLYRGIHLVIIHAEDLSLHGMLRKVGRILPLRNLAGQEPLIDLLEDASLTYQAAAAAGRTQPQTPGE
jgi:hypothetical protein